MLRYKEKKRNINKMRWPVKDKMNSTKTPDIVSGENVDTMIGHYQWEVSTDFLGHSTCVFFIFVEEMQLSPATSGQPGNAQSDQLHEEISHCTGHRKVHHTAMDAREGDRATNTQAHWFTNSPASPRPLSHCLQK